MTRALSEAQLQQYRSDGCCFPIEVMGETEALALRRQVEAIESEYGASLRPYLRENPHYVLSCIDRLIRHEVILDAVERIIGADILVWSSAFFIKEARTPSFVGWHQDARYWGIEPHEGVSAWVSFGHSQPANGCMRFIPGSHLVGMLEHDDTFAPDNVLSRGQRVHELDESNATDVILKPGQISLHHMRVVHGSEPNTSGQRRMGLAINYMPAHVRQTMSPDAAILVRGRDRFQHFEPGRAPLENMEPEALAFYERITNRQLEILHHGAAQRRAME